MKDRLEFTSAIKFKPGIIFSLLSRSFADIWNDELEKKLGKFDREVFENPDTVGVCTFVAVLNDEPIGAASYDPRQWPELCIIGYNCIVPKLQGKGYGKKQVNEMLRRLKEKKFRKAVVITSEHPFFASARNMYEACGFKQIKRYDDINHPGYWSVDYEIELG